MMKIMNISKQENNIWSVYFKILQVITLFQVVAASKSDNIIQNLTTDDQITLNKQPSFFLF